MIPFKKLPATVSVLLSTIFVLNFSAPARSQTKSSGDARALLQEVRKRELERQIAAKQTELDRLNEDLTKSRSESDELKHSIDGIVLTISETTGHLDQLSAEKTRLNQALEVANLRMEAEKLKLTGLKMLNDAQTKALGTLTSRIEDTDNRATVGAAELKLVSEGPVSDGGDAGTTDNATKLRAQIAELKKKRAKSERSTADANTAAHEAMAAASAKLQLADIAAGKAKKRAEELGLNEAVSASTTKDTITGPKAIPVH
jgi:DNA repair exonuclease SbcCD ATPase subunit